MKINNPIRKIKIKDKKQWKLLYKGYASFYKVEINNQILETVWKWLFDKNHELNGLVYEIEGTIVALAHYRKMPSPLRGKYIGFLDDLYVNPNHRGEKIGEYLLNELKIISKSKGWDLVRWITRSNNKNAKSLYYRVSEATNWEVFELK